ncbi:hypothetical protein AHAS_AhasUnG0010200 [Arachis hypogaea]
MFQSMLLSTFWIIPRKMYGLMRLLRNIYSWVGQALLFWFMVSLGSMVHPGGEIELQEIVNGLINTQIFPQPLLINGLLTYTKECGSFDKFLPLYLFLRCLDFSKLHGHAEEKCYSPLGPRHNFTCSNNN